jgi:hypothetical protein
MTDEIEGESKASAESRTLLKIFDRDKSAALEAVQELAELIPQLKIDAWLDDDCATDEDRPMRALRVAQQLCAALERIERAKVICEVGIKTTLGIAFAGP